MKYLAPYVFRVAISDRRIRSIEPGVDGQGQVVYEYRPSGTSRARRCLSVPRSSYVASCSMSCPEAFARSGYYGLASARCEMDVELLKWLVTITLQMVYVITIGARQVIAKPSAKCHHCGGHLRLYGVTLPTVIGYDTS